MRNLRVGVAAAVLALGLMFTAGAQAHDRTAASAAKVVETTNAAALNYSQDVFDNNVIATEDLYSPCLSPFSEPNLTLYNQDYENYGFQDFGYRSATIGISFNYQFNVLTIRELRALAPLLPTAAQRNYFNLLASKVSYMHTANYCAQFISWMNHSIKAKYFPGVYKDNLWLDAQGVDTLPEMFSDGYSQAHTILWYLHKHGVISTATYTSLRAQDERVYQLYFNLTSYEGNLVYDWGNQAFLPDRADPDAAFEN